MDFFNLEGFGEAVEAYRRAVAIAPRNGGYHAGLALALKADGKIAESLAASDDAIRVAPRGSHGHLEKASLLQQQKRFLEALDVLSQGLVILADRSLDGCCQRPISPRNSRASG